MVDPRDVRGGAGEIAREPLASGALRTVLIDHIDAPGQFRLLWPSNRNLSPKVRVLVDFLSQRLFIASCDDWSSFAAS